MPSNAPEGNCPVCLLRVGLISAGQQKAYPGPRRFFGEYEIVEQIARGGMGIVYKAHHPALNRVVALKVIAAGHLASESHVRRFRAEAEAAAQLDHPNIVPIYEVGEFEREHFLTMKLVDGGNLAERMCCDEFFKASPVERIRRSVSLIVSIAWAVDHAHKRGILHRDLKPSNILIDRQGQPYVTDFGLAKLVDRDLSLTSVDAVMGTPHYMCPEQLDGHAKQLTVTADVYALGVMLYQLITDQLPFSGGTPLALMTQIASHEPQSPRKLNPEVNRDLETICLTCLKKNPAARYSSAKELAEDLMRWTKAEPISARPSSPWERLRRWGYRRPALATLLIAGILGLTAVFGVALLYSTQLRAKILEVNEQARRAEETNTRLQLQRAEHFFTSGRSTLGISHLAAVLRNDVSNRVAAERLIWALSGRDFAVPAGNPVKHQGSVSCVEFSPDGRSLVSASDDGSARIWNVETGAPSTEWLRHEASVTCARFSPDGSILATASHDHTTRLWSTGSNKPPSSKLRHDGPVYYCEFSADGSFLLTASADGTARIWNTGTGQPVGEPLRHDDKVYMARFSPDRQWIVSCSADGTAKVWDNRATTRPLQTLRHTSPVTSAEFSSDGQKILTVSERRVRIFDTLNGQLLGAPLRQSNNVRIAHFSPDARHIVTALQPGSLWLWRLGSNDHSGILLDAHANYELVTFNFKGDRFVTVSQDSVTRVWDTLSGSPVIEPIQGGARVRQAAFSQDGSRIATAGDNGVQIWDVRPRSLAPETYRHQGRVWRAEFSPDGRWLVTASSDGTAIVVRHKPPHRGNKIILKHSTAVRRAQFSQDSRWIITASEDRFGRVWDVETGELSCVVAHDDTVRSVAISPNGNDILTAGKDNTARLWERQTGKLKLPILRHESCVHVAAFNNTGNLIATGSEDGSLKFWSPQTGQRMMNLPAHQGPIFRMQFGPDEKTLATASDDRSARLWDVSTGDALTDPLWHKDSVRAISFSPDGMTIATGSWDKTACLWDVRTGKPRSQPLQHVHWVNSVQFTPDSRRLITASSDGTSRVWDANTGQELSDPLKHRDIVYSAAVSPDGTSMITASADHTAQVWRIPVATGAVPWWLVDLAEGLAGQTIDDDDRIHTVSTQQLLKIRKFIGMTESNDYYVQWAKWFFARSGALDRHEPTQENFDVSNSVDTSGGAN